MSEKLSIKSWSAQDRPREKLLSQGRQALTDAELIAILIGSGSVSESAVSLSQRILSSSNNDLYQLGKVDLSTLLKFKGIGEAKAITILAALELGRRRKEQSPRKKQKITCSNDSYLLMHSQLSDLDHEEFWIVLLNRANLVQSKHRISIGGVSQTIVDTKIIYKLALEQLASGIILFHNHPSGNLKASESDIKLTRKIKSAGQVLDIKVLDHIIITDEGYFSFADNAIL